MAEKSRLSFNQITLNNWSVQQAVEGCVRHEIPSIALWRQKIAEAGLPATVRAVRDAGLHVSSVCRGGMFPAATAEGRRQNLEDNFRAVEEAAALAADVLVLVVGGCAGLSLPEARRMVADGVAELVPWAAQHQVKLGLEPLHPMFAADRSVLNTIDQALAIAELYPADRVGLVLDVFHIWWDPQVSAQIARAAGRIVGFHVNDWLNPLPDVLLGRGMMGDGVIDIHPLRLAVDEAGYRGPIEVEILNRSIWESDPDRMLEQIIERFTHLV